MGCGGSIYDNPKISKYRRQFELLGLSEPHVKKLWQLFNKADVTKDEKIGILESLMMMDVENTPFNRKAFAVFDQDKSGEISFFEFVGAIYDICTVSRESLVTYAFELYDTNDDLQISSSEAIGMLKDFYGAKFSTSHAAKTVAADMERGVLADGKITPHEFYQFSKTHQSLMHPVFDLQKTLQKITLGEREWNRYEEKRNQLTKGKHTRLLRIVHPKSAPAAKAKHDEHGKHAAADHAHDHDPHVKHLHGEPPHREKKHHDHAHTQAVTHADPNHHSGPPHNQHHHKAAPGVDFSHSHVHVNISQGHIVVGDDRNPHLLETNYASAHGQPSHHHGETNKKDHVKSHGHNNAHAHGMVAAEH